MVRKRRYLRLLPACLMGVLGLGWAGAAAAVDGQGDTTAADQCEVKVEVMAVVYDHKHPRRSFAMVVRGGKAGRMVRAGSWLSGKPVLAVLPEAVWLGTEEDPCWIPLDHEGKQRAAPRRKAKKRRKKKKRRKR